MQVNDAEIAVVFPGILQVNKVFERAKIVADMQPSRRLDS